VLSSFSYTAKKHSYQVQITVPINIDNNAEVSLVQQTQRNKICGMRFEIPATAKNYRACGMWDQFVVILASMTFV
jgi:hypothetical protein